MRRIVRTFAACAAAAALVVGCSDDGRDGQDAARAVPQSEMPPTPELRAEPAPPKLASAKPKRPARNSEARSRPRRQTASAPPPAAPPRQTPAQPAPAPAPAPAPPRGAPKGGGDEAQPSAAKPEVVECDPRCP